MDSLQAQEHRTLSHGVQADYWSTLRAVFAAALHYLARQGISTDRVQEQLGVQDGWIQDATNLELVMGVANLVDAGLELGAPAQFGLELGAEFHPCLGGIAGFAASYAPHALESLRVFSRYSKPNDLFQLAQSSSGDEYRFQVAKAPNWSERVQWQVTDTVIAGLHSIIQHIHGAKVAALEVYLRRPKPTQVERYDKCFGVPVRFGEEESFICYSGEVLLRPNVMANPFLYEQLLFLAKLVAPPAVSSKSTQGQVIHAIRGGAMTMQEVAQVLSLNTRTLQRRLKESNTSFRAVLNETRMELAQDLLQHSETPISDIAERLLYSNDKAFRRALKRATGQTPGDIRRFGSA